MIALMDKIMTPSSWFTTLVYKPFYALQIMRTAVPWKYQTGIPKTHRPIVSFFQALRTSAPPFPTNNLKVGAAGFCWGGKHTILLAQDTSTSKVTRHESQANSVTPQRLIDCAFTAHPSYIEVPRDIETITIPISVTVGDGDMAMKAPLAQQMKEILEGKKKGDHEVVIMQDAKHGFAIRTHPDDEHEMECAGKAEAQAVEWFTKWLT
jgi:dienelactone hydrolase